MQLTNKTVLVTGADGFIGSHLVQALVAHGVKVRPFVYYNSFNSWGWLDTFPAKTLEKLDVFAGDIRDPNGVLTAMKGCDVVFHLAALIAIPFSYHSPDSYIDTNIKGTLNVLQAARSLGTERVLVTSTSEVYGTARYVPIDESHPYQGQSPYSATKIGADKLAESFYKSFKTPVVIVRPFNTYGPRQSARAVIPTIACQLLCGESILKLGDVAPTRDFNFVSDTVNGFLALSECDKAVGEEVNIATGTEHSVLDIANILINEINPDAVIETDNARLRPQASEVYKLVGDNSKIKHLTNWKPQYDLKTGLKKTVDWLKRPENLSKYKPLIYNV